MKINLNILEAIITEYRNAQQFLMNCLNEEYDNSNSKDASNWINNGNVPQKGLLKNGWDFTFHGGDCQFFNKESNQTVEVVLSNNPDFAHIDAWFLMQYIESTKKYAKLSEGLRRTDLKTLIQQLYDSNRIENIKK